MDKITRTITTSVITAAKLHFEDGQPVFTQFDPLTVVGRAVTKEDAPKLLSKKYPEVTDTIVIVDIVTKEELREMSVETFIQCSTVVTPKAPEVTV